MPLQWLVALGLAVITLGAIAIFVTQYTKRRQTAIAGVLRRSWSPCLFGP